MKKSKNIFYFLIVFTLIFWQKPVYCTDSITTKLNNIEKTYYGYTYSDSIEKRLQRLEKNVYGTPNTNPKSTQQSRTDKLYKDLAMEENSVSQTNSIDDIGPKADAGIKYPIVDKMEQKIFQKTYINDDIYDRLARLENQTFGNNYKKSTQSLNERVDALRNKILGGAKTTSVSINPSKEEIILENGQRYYGDYSQNSNTLDEDQGSHYNYYSYENSKNRIPETQSSNDYDTGEMTGHADSDLYSNHNIGTSYDLDILEKSLLGKKYQGETPSKRLSRLESRVFSRTFDDGEEARIQRLLAVTTAKKTSQEYDSNKWARRLNAGLQIGGIILMVLCMIL